MWCTYQHIFHVAVAIPFGSRWPATSGEASLAQIRNFNAQEGPGWSGVFGKSLRLQRQQPG